MSDHEENRRGSPFIPTAWTDHDLIPGFSNANDSYQHQTATAAEVPLPFPLQTSFWDTPTQQSRVRTSTPVIPEQPVLGIYHLPIISTCETVQHPSPYGHSNTIPRDHVQARALSARSDTIGQLWPSNVDIPVLRSSRGFQHDILQAGEALFTGANDLSAAYSSASVDRGSSVSSTLSRDREMGVPGKSAPRRSRTRIYGPFDEASKSKVAGIRESRACWRCRRYKKPCDDEPVCKSCTTAGFRVWPSNVGCRRDSLEAFTMALFPANLEYVLMPIASNPLRPANWRRYVQRNLLQPIEDAESLHGKVRGGMSYTKFLGKATGMYGHEFDDLLDIVSRWQNCQLKQNVLIDAACASLSLCCEFYCFFVDTPGHPDLGRGPPARDMVPKLRTSFSKVFRLVVSHCLSPDRADWCPAILAMSLAGVSICVLMDAAFAVPEPARSKVWGPDIYTACNHIRHGIYNIILDLLRVKADDDTKAGPRPMLLDCWRLMPQVIHARSQSTSYLSPGGVTSTIATVSDPEQSEPLIRDPAGMALVNSNISAFDGFADLQAWTRKYMAMLAPHGDQYFSNDPYSQPDLPPIINLSTLLGV